MHYIGLDVHKQSIVFCIKTGDGEVVDQGTLEATRSALEEWAATLPQPWQGAMEATQFSGWIHDTLSPYADDLAVAHPADLEAITKAKKKSDTIDADKVSDLLRIDMLPRVWMPPRQWRELRRLLRYRNRLIEQAVWHKNRIATALMELGEPYVKSKLHTKSYFYPFLDKLETGEEDAFLLCASRDRLEESERLARTIEKKLLRHPLLERRVALLQTIPGVGVMTALTWAIEIGDLNRFHTLDQMVSYCGLCARLDESAGKAKRGPLSKRRNRHLQRVLIEAAKLAPRFNEELAALHAKECERGHRNRATVQVARALVARLRAVDARGTPYEKR
ncbi:MAG: IS110 family transposase [Deltaproteobacteria bacterium]|nr:MAG: IS110 family transposase [Deltaproteobacteria bacterium]